jgi:hypothetical protein
MEWKDIAQEWKAFRLPIREQWAKLTDAQLDAIDGNREQFIRTIRQVYAISQEQTEKQVAAWVKRVARPSSRAPLP